MLKLDSDAKDGLIIALFIFFGGIGVGMLLMGVLVAVLMG